MAVKQHEIKDLKTKCKHLQEVVEYYKSNNMSSEEKNSTNNNNMNEAAQEYSVNKP